MGLRQLIILVLINGSYINGFMARFQSFYDLNLGFFDPEMAGQEIDQGLVGLAVNGRGVQMNLDHAALFTKRILLCRWNYFNIKQHMRLRKG